MKPSLWRSIRMIGWSFFGVRKGSESKEDIAQAHPFHIIVAGIAGAAVFVVGLMLLVKWVVAS